MIAGVGTIVILITITFLLTRCMPGNPFQSNEISDTVLHAMEKEYGLTEPLPVQYITYLRHLVQGDMGISYKKPGVSVNDVIGRALPITLTIGALAFVSACLLGISLGIWQATTKSHAVRSGILLVTTLGVGIPNFVIALLLLLIFGVGFKWLPIAGVSTPFHYILPVLSLMIYPASVITRYTSNSFLEHMNQDYIRMARAKQMPWHLIVRRHLFKNAMIPVLNAMGPMIAFLLTGSFVVESIFTIPGLGREFVSAISNRDYTMIMGLTIFMGTIVILVNLTIDIICACMDPRTKRGMVL